MAACVWRLPRNRIAAARWLPRSIEPYAGKPITLGVRPEHCGCGRSRLQYPVLSTQYSTEQLPFAATVEAVERLGAETHVHLKAGDQLFIARSKATSGRPWRQVLAADGGAPAVLRRGDGSGDEWTDRVSRHRTRIFTSEIRYSANRSPSAARLNRYATLLHVGLRFV